MALCFLARIVLLGTDSAAKADPHSPPERAVQNPDQAHAELFQQTRFPSAKDCGSCHPKHFREWSGSQHAYAQLSPIFNSMHRTLLVRTNGTNGDFCIRCHTPVGMALGEDPRLPNPERHPVSLEGVTCIVCHRVSENYGKINARGSLDEGPLTEPVKGPTGRNDELARALRDGGVSSDPKDSGRKVHGKIEPFFDLQTPGFCGSCHDVTFINGFRLEEAFSEYKNSPASQRGVSCQDCHMGKEPGRTLADKAHPEFEKLNYDFGPAAKVGQLETRPRKLTSHKFVGPDYSVLPPYLFPIRDDLIRNETSEPRKANDGLATLKEWLLFDLKGGWGTDEFEDEVDEDHPFPEAWSSVDDRYDARELLDESLERLQEIAQDRLTLLRNGYKLSEITLDRADPKELAFHLVVSNGTDGHGVPTGFDAERVVWLFVQVQNRDGVILWQSGDLDPNGDVRDLHSHWVHDRKLPLDDQLFSLQSRFLTRNLRGGEREQVLNVNTSATPLPFARPFRRSSILNGGPSGARKHKMGIEPLGSRKARYRVRGEKYRDSSPLTITAQLKTAMVPVNLVLEVQGVGFDYDLTTQEIIDALVAGHQVLWQRELEVEIGSRR